MTKGLGAVIERTPVKETCRHHWIIEAPSGPTSKGVCKLCGAEKEFINYPENVWLRDDVPAFLKTEDLIDTEDNIEEIEEDIAFN